MIIDTIINEKNNIINLQRNWAQTENIKNIFDDLYKEQNSPREPSAPPYELLADRKLSTQQPSAPPYGTASAPTYRGQPL
jgi:hypothetical protein